jgi:NAD(P)-dependent dehydrogenase (short-subunit alcohol dehydrogenase family)
MDMFSLAGKKVLVTGAAQGIGHGVARGVLAAGADVAIVDLDPVAVERAAAELGAEAGRPVGALTCDVGDAAQVRRLVPTAVEWLGGLDVAINNAGVGNAGDAVQTTDEEWERVYRVNAGGVFFCCREEGRWFLANEWAPHGIRVNAVSPGFTITPMVETPRMKPQQDAWAALTPMGRIARVEDLVGAYVFLASDASRHVTGLDLVVDGGYTLR